MKELLILTTLTGVLVITFLVILVWGIFRRKKKFIALIGIHFLLLAGVAGYTSYKWVVKSYRGVKEMIRPRTGEEIYAALFHLPQSDCMKMIQYQDQVVPKIDYAIWLHFQTCPDELQRILSLRSFDRDTLSTKNMHSEGPLAQAQWFKPETLGDTVLIFRSINSNGNGQIIYSNQAQTEVYCMDILD